MSDLRESGSLEQDADLIMLLHRPEYYEEENRPGEADIMWLSTAMVRPALSRFPSVGTSPASPIWPAKRWVRTLTVSN